MFLLSKKFYIALLVFLLFNNFTFAENNKTDAILTLYEDNDLSLLNLYMDFANAANNSSYCISFNNKEYITDENQSNDELTTFKEKLLNFYNIGISSNKFFWEKIISNIKDNHKKYLNISDKNQKKLLLIYVNKFKDLNTYKAFINKNQEEKDRIFPVHYIYNSLWNESDNFLAEYKNIMKTQSDFVNSQYDKLFLFARSSIENNNLKKSNKNNENSFNISYLFYVLVILLILILLLFICLLLTYLKLNNHLYENSDNIKNHFNDKFTTIKNLKDKQEKVYSETSEIQKQINKSQNEINAIKHILENQNNSIQGLDSKIENLIHEFNDNLKIGKESSSTIIVEKLNNLFKIIQKANNSKQENIDKKNNDNQEEKNWNDLF